MTTETHNSETSPERSWVKAVRIATRIVLGLILAFVALVVVGSLAPIQVVGILATGWMNFLSRTLAKISWNWDLIVTGFICLGLVLFLAHRFLRWLAQGVAAARGRSWNWPWRWTWCGTAAIGVLFLVGMAAGGIVHQIGWISSTPGPWTEAQRSTINDMRQLDGLVQQAFLETTNNLPAVRRLIWDPKSELAGGRWGPNLIQLYHYLMIKDANGEWSGVIIFPRDYRQRPTGSILYYFGNENGFLPIQELPKLIEKHQNNLMAL